METRVLCVLFARLLVCEINLCTRVRVACKHTCEDVNLLQVCTRIPVKASRSQLTSCMDSLHCSFLAAGN